MTTYTDVFSTDAIPPSQNAFVAVTLTANTTFYWPELATGSDLMADIMEITASSTYDLTLPSAAQVSVGRDVLFRNVGANAFTVKDNAGGTIGTLAAGEAKLVYLADNSTAAGVWRIFTFGTGTSAADASALAGYGMKVTGATLSQNYISSTSAGTVTVATTDRAKTMISSNAGAVTYNLPAASTAGDGFFVAIVNQGTGSITIDPNGAETVDGASTKAIAPGESCTLVTDGALWVTVGYGRSTQFQFTKLVLDVSAGSPFTLTSTQAENKLMQFIGTVTGAVTVNVPAVVAVYYLQCSYSGAFSLTFKTAAGTGVTLSGTDRAIVYCDGTDVVLAQTSAVPATDIAGGVAGSVVYQDGVGSTNFTAAGNAGELLESAGTGTPVWRNIGNVINNLTGKTTPVDADSLAISDSAASNVGKKLTWANLKATFLSSLGALIAAATGKTTPVGADMVVIADSEASNATKMVTLTNLQATIGGASVSGNNTWTGTQTFRDNKFEITDDGDTTKKVAFQASGITTGTTRTVTIPDKSGTMAMTSDITSGASVLGMFRNLQASATGTNANITVTADEIALEDGSNSYYTARSVSLTIAGTSTGANALDAGTIAGSTWYSVWVIYNGATVAGLISTSATAPTMPSGYTYKARVGWIRTDGTANKYPLSFIQFGRRVSYKLAAGSNLTTWPQLASGASGSPTVPTWTAVAWANYAPSTAAAIEILTGTTTSGGGGTNYALVHSNNAAGSNLSTTAGPLIQAIGIDTGGSGFVGRVRGDIPIESSNIYWASTGASAFLNAVGWEDNI